MTQKVKNAPADDVNPVMKYRTREKIETWNKMTGMSAASWAIQKAAGWNKAKDLCLSKTGRPVKESVTSDMAINALKRTAKKQAPDLTKSPAEVFGAL